MNYSVLSVFHCFCGGSIWNHSKYTCDTWWFSEACNISFVTEKSWFNNMLLVEPVVCPAGRSNNRHYPAISCINTVPPQMASDTTVMLNPHRQCVNKSHKTALHIGLSGVHGFTGLLWHMSMIQVKNKNHYYDIHNITSNGNIRLKRKRDWDK